MVMAEILKIKDLNFKVCSISKYYYSLEASLRWLQNTQCCMFISLHMQEPSWRILVILIYFFSF